MSGIRAAVVVVVAVGVMLGIRLVRWLRTRKHVSKPEIKETKHVPCKVAYESAIQEQLESEQGRDLLSLEVERFQKAFAEHVAALGLPVPDVSDDCLRMSDPAVAEAYRLACIDLSFMKIYKDKVGFSGSPTAVRLLVVYLAERVVAPVMLGAKLTATEIRFLRYWKA